MASDNGDHEEKDVPPGVHMSAGWKLSLRNALVAGRDIKFGKYSVGMQGTVHLVWSRNRWAISPGEYPIVIFAGGLYLSIVDSEHGQGPLDDILDGLGG